LLQLLLPLRSQPLQLHSMQRFNTSSWHSICITAVNPCSWRCWLLCLR
jgi:hypothetical protein